MAPGAPGHIYHCRTMWGVFRSAVLGRGGGAKFVRMKPTKPMDYGSESPEARRLRREARWTPVTAESL
jgi:hypothetical protein